MAKKQIQRRTTLVFDLEDAVNDSTVQALTGVSIGKQFEIFIREEVKARNLRTATERSYRDAFKKYLTTMGIDDDTIVTDLRVKDYQIALLDSGLEDRSVSSYIRNIRPFFYWLMRAGVVAAERVREPKVDARPFTSYKAEELAILTKPPANNARFTEVRNWAIVNFLIGTGCRVGSVPHVRVRDIDFDNMTVQLSRVKTRTAYQIPLAKELAKVLRLYMMYFSHVFSDKQDSFWLFPNQYEEQLTSDGLKHAMADYNKSRGVTRTSLHDYRRAYALNHLRLGGTIEQLRELLGHKDISTTVKYFKLQIDDLKQNYDEHNLLNTVAAEVKKRQRGETIKRKK